MSNAVLSWKKITQKKQGRIRSKMPTFRVLRKSKKKWGENKKKRRRRRTKSLQKTLRWWLLLRRLYLRQCRNFCFFVQAWWQSWTILFIMVIAEGATSSSSAGWNGYQQSDTTSQVNSFYLLLLLLLMCCSVVRVTECSTFSAMSLFRIVSSATHATTLNKNVQCFFRMDSHWKRYSQKRWKYNFYLEGWLHSLSLSLSLRLTPLF